MIATVIINSINVNPADRNRKVEIFFIVKYEE
ncbi:hypothetical protein POHY109586_00710 [Polaromonas hydrogenivorans]